MHQGRRGWRPGAEPSAIIAAASVAPETGARPASVPVPQALSRSPPAFPTSPCLLPSRWIRAPTRPRPIIRAEQPPPRWSAPPCAPDPSGTAPCPEPFPCRHNGSAPPRAPRSVRIRTCVRHASHSMPVANYSPEPFAPGNDPRLSTWATPSPSAAAGLALRAASMTAASSIQPLKRPRIPGPVRHRSADRVRVDVDLQVSNAPCPSSPSEISLLERRFRTRQPPQD